MKKIYGILLVAAIFIATTAFAPSLAKRTVNIHNDTEVSIKVTFIGDDDKFNYTIAPGWAAKEIPEGSYEVKYTACGVDFAFSLTVLNDTEVIQIDVCPKGVQPSKFVIESHFDDPIDVEFISFEETYGTDYTFTVESGRNRFKGIKSGWYFYSYDACDTTFTGEFRILKNGRGRLTMRSCERAFLFEAGIRPIDTKLIVRSQFSPSFGLTLIGPVSQYVEISTGATRVDLPAGNYTYFYAVNGRRFSGLVVVRGDGTTVFDIGHFDYVTIPAESE